MADTYEECARELKAALATPPKPAPGALRCANCGAALHSDEPQPGDWCLDCNMAYTPTENAIANKGKRIRAAAAKAAALSPLPTVAAEAVAWQMWDGVAWLDCNKPNPYSQTHRIVRPLYASPPLRGEREAPRWKHKKRGTLYTEIGRGKLQTMDAGGLTDGEPMVIYRGDDGQLWVRDQVEFEDGRFEFVPPSAQSSPAALSPTSGASTGDGNV